jgi:hypothetical protein
MGVFAQAIRPPTVPAGTSRLRLTAMASHTPTELRMAAEVFADAARRVGLEPSSFLSPAPDSAEEIEEVETALARAERLARGAAVHQDAGPPSEGEHGRPSLADELQAVTSAPFDFERDSSPAQAA